MDLVELMRRPLVWRADVTRLGPVVSPTNRSEAMPKPVALKRSIISQVIRY
jgi:hypothetical protein